MKAQLLSIEGKKIKEIELPKEFSEKIREDLVEKVLEAKKTKQPYSPSPVAGKQHAAKGKVVHRRHVWRSGYGSGNSRVPKKIFSRKGSQFNWTAAEVPFARGGMRAHPPKIVSMINTLKINKKEQKIAFASALSATANAKKITEKYSRLNEVKNVPFVVEGKIVSLKTKQILESLEKILGKEVFEVAVKKKSVRAGIGKRRGRKYKSTAGMLFVVGDNEKLKTGAFDVVNANKLSIVDLAKGGVGRLVVYTENAIKKLGERK
ncbi:MAG: 50S ribosomal protein L4 [Candidatus Pacearchaeota archaeon]